MGFEEDAVGDIKILARKRSRSCVFSIPSENCFNAAKNAKLVKGKKKFRRPEKSYAAMIARRVESKVHKFQHVLADAPLQDAPPFLSKETFEADPSKCSLDLSHVVSTSCKTPWTTHGPDDVSRSVADLQMVVQLNHGPGFPRMEFAWIGEICDWTHHLAISKAGKPNEWYIPLRHYSDSAVLCAPTQKVVFPGSDHDYFFRTSSSPTEPLYITITSLDDWMAYSYTWRSPTWQRLSLTAVAAELLPAARRVAHSAAKKLTVVAAENCFWRLGRVFLAKIAAHLKI